MEAIAIGMDYPEFHKGLADCSSLDVILEYVIGEMHAGEDDGKGDDDFEG